MRKRHFSPTATLIGQLLRGLGSNSDNALGSNSGNALGSNSGNALGSNSSEALGSYSGEALGSNSGEALWMLGVTNRLPRSFAWESGKLS